MMSRNWGGYYTYPVVWSTSTGTDVRVNHVKGTNKLTN
jgi:hypothetical protein